MCPICDIDLQPMLAGMVCEGCGFIVSFGEYEEIYAKYNLLG